MTTQGYQLLDFGNARRLEQWGPYRLVRPDPTAIGIPRTKLWQTAHAVYEGQKGQGTWQTRDPIPPDWPVHFDDLRLLVKLAPYKHTGVFPEQQQNWHWMRTTAKRAARPLRILNLFAYTGGATIALAKDGHFVTHVDSSKPAIAWAKINADLNALPPDRIRWMLEDAPLFAQREVKRQKKYDAILLDPPAFGHSPTGKAWVLNRDLPPLLQACSTLLSDSPAFWVLNGYAQHNTPDSLRSLLQQILHSQLPARRATIDASELLLPTPDARSLSTGIVARCTFP